MTQTIKMDVEEMLRKPSVYAADSTANALPQGHTVRSMVVNVSASNRAEVIRRSNGAGIVVNTSTSKWAGR